ncbi:MAG: hypothetical protein LBG45_02035 [Dysgonamonadaceae bacterium]|nr:hypothetical protein [Dysgonamonadaceae bacterium]
MTEEEREALLSLTKPGKCSSRKVIHSFIRLNADKGEYKESDKKINSRDIASFLKVGERMIDRYNFR